VRAELQVWSTATMPMRAPRCLGSAAIASGYFHVVYTLPAPLRDIAYQNKRLI
jgi:hypothetical protein